MEYISLKSISNEPALPTPATMASGGQTISSPCAGCKFLRRKCQPDCVFAPYFPPDQPQKFVNVHRVFGASNVTKILNELNSFEREDAVNSLAYEAEMRLRNPVYGCVGIISLLQRQLRQLQIDLSHARLELVKYQSAAEGIEMEQLQQQQHQQQQQQQQQQYQQQQQQQRMMMVRGYAAAEFGGNEGYDAGLMVAMGMAGSFARPNTTSGDDRHSTLGVIS